MLDKRSKTRHTDDNARINPFQRLLEHTRSQSRRRARRPGQSTAAAITLNERQEAKSLALICRDRDLSGLGLEDRASVEKHRAEMTHPNCTTAPHVDAVSSYLRQHTLSLQLYDAACSREANARKIASSLLPSCLAEYIGKVRDFQVARLGRRGISRAGVETDTKAMCWQSVGTRMAKELECGQSTWNQATGPEIGTLFRTVQLSGGTARYPRATAPTSDIIVPTFAARHASIMSAITNYPRGISLLGPHDTAHVWACVRKDQQASRDSTDVTLGHSQATFLHMVEQYASDLITSAYPSVGEERIIQPPSLKTFVPAIGQDLEERSKAYGPGGRERAYRETMEVSRAIVVDAMTNEARYGPVVD
jgi:hypothetical protein